MWVWTSLYITKNVGGAYRWGKLSEVSREMSRLLALSYSSSP